MAFRIIHEDVEIAVLRILAARNGAEDSWIHAAIVRHDGTNAFAVKCQGL